MDLFKLDPGLFLWTWITFGLLLLLLWKFVFPGLFGAINSREKKIKESVNKAEKIEQRLAEIESEHAGIMQKAHEDADEILRKTRIDAEVLRKKLLEKAEQDLEALHEQAAAAIADERAAAVEAVRAEMAELVCAASQKLVEQSFSTEDDRQRVMELIKTL